MSHPTVPRSQSTPEPPYHVVACDMDGTLLDAKHDVTPFTKATIQALIRTYQLPQPQPPPLRRPSSALYTGPQYRVFFVLASGRHVQDLRCILERLELPKCSAYIVSSNGAKAHCIASTPPPLPPPSGSGSCSGSTDSSSSGGANGNAGGSTGGDDDGAAVAVADGRLYLQEVFSASMLPSQVYRLLRLLPADEDEVNINLYKADGWHCSLDWSGELQYYVSGFRYAMFSPVRLIAAYEAFMEAEVCRSRSNNDLFSEASCDDHPKNPLRGVEKLFFGSDDTERLQRLARIVTNLDPDPTPAPVVVGVGEGVAQPFRVTLAFSSPCCMELTAAGVSKVSGLEHLMPILEGRSDSVARWSMADTCVAFGDGENDYEMLRAAAKGCVMANSRPELKARLEAVPTVEVIGSNVDDGVARELIARFNLQV